MPDLLSPHIDDEDARQWEEVAYVWRLMATEAIHALAALQQRERSLEDQLSAVRQELSSVRDS